MALRVLIQIIKHDLCKDRILIIMIHKSINVYIEILTFYKSSYFLEQSAEGNAPYWHRLNQHLDKPVQDITCVFITLPDALDSGNFYTGC